MSPSTRERLPSEDAITSGNYRQKLGRGKRRRARQRAFYLEALRDPASIKGTGGTKLYASVIESGVVTHAIWLLIQALPAEQREEYEQLTADSIIFYPRVLAAVSGPEYDELVEKYRSEALSWESSLDLTSMEQIRRKKIDAEYVTLKYPIGDDARQIGQFRQESQQSEGKGSGMDIAWKVHANSMYGVLASTYLPTNNIVAANQITAWARGEAFALSQALNAIQTITDGCTYRRDQIPACSYEECLRIKPDYPIRRAEDGDGIPFLDPKDIPQQDASFTDWYRDHVKKFFRVTGSEYDELFATHRLEHKKTGKTKQVAFDALACDGSGNYLKATRDAEGNWLVEDFAARSYGKKSKQGLQGWVVRTYSTDTLTEPSPVVEDTELLSFRRAAQKARAALDAGVPEVYFPLGLENTKTMNYRVLKPSAFTFNSPEQRTAIVKHWLRFEDRYGAGLEVLALRRGYKSRRQGSLMDLAEELYQLIRSGGTNLTKSLNLNKKSNPVQLATESRAQAIEQQKAMADRRLVEVIDARNLPPEALPTAYLVTANELLPRFERSSSKVGIE